MENKIEIGDEVQHYTSKGEPLFGTRFIVTEIGNNFLAGIDFGGDIYMFETDDDAMNWKKTGRHYDILGTLQRLRDE